MTKRMFALWGEVDSPDPVAATTAERAADLAAGLHRQDLRDALAGAGVTRLQVNVDDEVTAPAMRIPAGELAIGAIVSTWAGAAGPIVEALAAVAGVSRVAGWEVEERRPIDPDETWDGSRVDALANIALLRRPEELTHEEWLHRWLVDHTPVAIATQGTFGYVQNVVVGAATPDAPPVAALVEELFPSAAITDIHAFYGSGGSDAELGDRMEKMMASVSRFGADRGLDLVPTSRYLYDLGRSVST